MVVQSSKTIKKVVPMPGHGFPVLPYSINIMHFEGGVVNLHTDKQTRLFAHSLKLRVLLNLFVVYCLVSMLIRRII